MEITIDGQTLRFRTTQLALAHILALYRDRRLDSEFTIRLGQSNYLFRVDAKYIYVYKNGKYLNRFSLSKVPPQNYEP